MGDLPKTRSSWNKEKWLPLAQMPFLISHYCCNIMKKQPIKTYERHNKVYPIIATMASESNLRKQAWLRHGCNAFDSSHKTSQPMSFWNEQDVLQYIKQNNLSIAPAYGQLIDCDGKLKCSKYSRTGCFGCAFGAHLKNEKDRYLLLKKYYPRLYDFVIGGGEWSANPYYDSTITDEPNEYGWIEWNPKEIWRPTPKGLGFGKVFDMINEVYGKEFMIY